MMRILLIMMCRMLLISHNYNRQWIVLNLYWRVNMAYICDGDVFETYEMAVEYANHVYRKTGIILGIEELK